MAKVKVRDQILRYDTNHDVLHIHLKEYRTVGMEDEEVAPGIIVRQDIKERGVTILDFSKKSKEFLENALPHYDFSDLDLDKILHKEE